MSIFNIILAISGCFILLLIGIFVVGFTAIGHGASVVDKKKSNQFYYQKDTVVYVSGANFFNIGEVKIPGVDRDSFRVLNYSFALDKGQVYYGERVISQADPKTFDIIEDPSGRLLDEYPYSIYGKDKQSVYYMDKKIPEADPKSFAPLWGRYTADKKNIYYYDKILLATVDAPDKVKNDIENEYLRLAETIYKGDKPLNITHPSSFELIREKFAKDKQYIYFEGAKCEGIDSASFEVLNKYFQKDVSNLYYQGRLIPSGDFASYEYLNYEFSKDKNNVYSFGSVVRNLDTAQFNKSDAERLKEGYKYVNLQYGTGEVEYIERDKITEIANRYSSYNGIVFMGFTEIVEADIDSFSIAAEFSSYSKDKTQAYFNGEKIVGVDIESFEAIAEGFAKDKSFVYFGAHRVNDVSPHTFEYKEGLEMSLGDNNTYNIVGSPESVL